MKEVMTADQARISHIGLVARSPEGHAAKGMQIKGHEDLWVEIQTNTFRNWVNENLKTVGERVDNLGTDLCDGTRLCLLIEVLQQRKLKPAWVKRPTNHHQYLENTTTALNAIAEDGVKLVNIGNVDIVNGNIKLILGLIWSLIVRYQIGRSKFPPKKLMLAWLKAVLPECKVSNFTTDWNSGIYLSALLDYCEPGIFPHWKNLNLYDRVENCRNAMELARSRFNVPMILEPEYLASPYLDELSGMTYLSYFMKENSPGFRSTLRWVNSQIPKNKVTNFTRDWNDGSALNALAKSLGASAKYQPSNDATIWESNLNAGITAGRKLGVEPILSAKDMVDQNVEHLGVMAYAAKFQWIPARTNPCLTVGASVETHTTRIYKPTNFKIDFLGDEVDPSDIKVEVTGPECSKLECQLTLTFNGGRGVFTPTQVGMHKLLVYNEGKIVRGCPIYIRTLPELSSITYTGMEPCAVGSIVEVLVNSHGAQAGLIEVIAVSPMGRSLACPVHDTEGVYSAKFQPDEPGEWTISVKHSDQIIQGGPYTCFVYDPNGVKLLGLDTPAVPESIFNFTLDATGTGGLGTILIDIVHHHESLPHTIDHLGNSVYRVSLHTRRAGKYKVYIYFNGLTVKGSPFLLRVGTKEQMKAEKTYEHHEGYEEDHHSSYPLIEKVDLPSARLLSSPPLVKSTQNLRSPMNSNFYAASSPNDFYHSSWHSPTPKSSRQSNVYSSSVSNSIGSTKHVSQPHSMNHVYEVGLPPVKSTMWEFPTQTQNSWDTSAKAPSDSVDGSGAGSGNLEILVNGGHVTSFVRNLGSQKFLASFVPHEAVVHHIEMKFNNESVPKSPWKIMVMGRGPATSLGPKMSVIGEAIRLVAVDSLAYFQISAVGFHKEDIHASVISPSKISSSAKVVPDGENGLYQIEFTPVEVGSHLVEVSVAGEKLPAGPLVAKVYNAGLIKVTDVTSGVIGQPCQFRVDASQAGEGQLEISINEGEVPNHVTVVGGGRCLVSFTPEHNKPHLIDIKFNGETVSGCPFVCAISDTSRVSVDFSCLELIPVNQVAKFHMNVDNSGSAELSVAVTSPTHELPVKVSGNVHSGFIAEFTPTEVGPHSISVDYNSHPIYGTPFVSKVYNSKEVLVGTVPQGHVGSTLQFKVDASQAGEGNLEITISARGANIPTQVHPQGNAKFIVSFLPVEPTDHIITIHFNKQPVPGSPFIASVVGDFPLVTGSALSRAPLGSDSYFTMSNVAGSLDDIEVNVEGPTGQSVPAQVKDAGNQTFNVEFCPRIVGEHKISINYCQVPISGSPFSCKVYDVNAIKVKSVKKGTVGHPVTFIVETSQAGPGNLEVTVNGGRVPTSAQAQGSHTYAISFTPRQAMLHCVDLHFNHEPVPGSPFLCNVIEAAKIIMLGEDKVSVDKPTVFAVECEQSAGIPQIQVLSPSRVALPVSISPAESAGRFNVSFTCNQVGDHSVEVKLNGSVVEGSPFLVKAYDASKVRVTDINSGTVGKPVYFNINASQAGAGNLEIIVSVNGCNVPNYVQSEGNAKFRVNFKPKEAAPHNLSVRFNGEPIPGSPFICRVMEAGQLRVSGEGIKMCPAFQSAHISIDCHGMTSNCQVIVTSPSNKKLDVELHKQENKLIATYVPSEVGRHSVHVNADGQPVKGSPFVCNVYNVENIKVTGLGTAKVGKPVTFSVNATEAGEGTLELIISTQQSTVKAEVVACARGLYDVTFVPHQVLPHFVNISFNEQELQGSPFRCDVHEVPNKKGCTATARGEGLNQVVLGRFAYFEVNPHTPDHGSIDVQIIGPDNSKIPAQIEKLETGLYQVKYKPLLVGIHMISIFQRKQSITKQPWSVQVFDPMQVKLFGVSESFCHRPASLKINTIGAGPGTLFIKVSAAGNEVKHVIREIEPGIYQVVYHPTLAALHKVHVHYNGMSIVGSPLEVSVTDPAVGRHVCASGVGLYQCRANRVSNFTIETAGRPSVEFDVVITGPQGAAVPVRCYQQKDGNLLAEFTATNTGVYKIDVLQGSRPVRGSPYLCQVYDASKVKVEKDTDNNVSVNDTISFKVLRKNAGFSELDVSVHDPAGQNLPLKMKSLAHDVDVIELQPSIPGDYTFRITYGGDPIPDSPMTFNVIESGVTRAWGNGLSKALLNNSTKFTISCCRPVTAEQPVVSISGPDHSLVNTNVVSSGEAEFEVTYIPTQVGVYEIHISWKSKAILGSPFHCNVVCLDKVKVIGEPSSLNRLPLVISTPTRITFDISQAGPGELSGSCEGPSGSVVPISIERLTSDTVQALLIPRNAGPHTLSLYYGDFPLPGSPYHANAEGSGGGVRVILTGKGLTGALCNSVAEFTIDGSQAGPGIPEVTLTGMKTDLKVDLQNTGDNIYKATYCPTVPGAYLLNVMWSDRQVKGCPLKVTVSAVCDAAKVLCSGEGLGIGTVGKDIRSFIDTRRAGPGELSAHCVGPHKVAYCELYDHGDGTFTLNVKPQEAGKHTLTVKYGGVDVPGSPFTLRVAGVPDASKVRVYGPGIEHGVLATFQSRFICDTRGAGAGQLTVRVRGPKGAFRVEMRRESQKDRTILCKFDPTEPGDYRVEVKWAGEHVPGSPFMVMIFDTQEELNRFLQGSHSPNSELYGSVAYSTGYAHITP
ncbi:filamin-B isoform X2 [Bemisia tabaci]|uniref:filamin-B isoform X2 n=1 Tax=Bemisia tabaci TaxID=7038 RepID=UPI003B27EF17